MISANDCQEPRVLGKVFGYIVAGTTALFFVGLLLHAANSASSGESGMAGASGKIAFAFGIGGALISIACFVVGGMVSRARVARAILEARASGATEQELAKLEIELTAPAIRYQASGQVREKHIRQRMN